MEVTQRKDWATRKVRLQKMKVPAPETWIHHVADSGPSGGARATVKAEKMYMRKVEAFHIDSRDMAAIAYSFVIMPSGRVYEGRGWGKSGGHTYGHNSFSHGVCFAGNFQSMRPTKRALAACRELLNDGTGKGFVRRPRKEHPTGGHRDVGAQGGGTACPGNNLYAKIPSLRKRR